MSQEISCHFDKRCFYEPASKGTTLPDYQLIQPLNQQPNFVLGLERPVSVEAQDAT
jgi:hypothetical protein